MDPEEQVVTEEPKGLDIESAVADIATSLSLVQEEEQPPAEEPAETPPEKEAEPPPAEEPPAEEPPAEEDPPPDTWTKEAKAKWAETPPEVRQELRKRENDIAKYAGEVKPKVEIANAFEKILTPYAELFTKYGVNPWDHIPRLLQAHTQLVFGSPQQKVQMFRTLAQDAGIDLAKLAGEHPTEAAENELMQTIQAQNRRIAQLEQGVTGVTTTIQSARAAELEQNVLAFAQDEENHPFFWEVTDQIQHFISTKAASNLEQAYKLAVMENPITRAKVIEREAEKAAAKKAAAAAEHAAKAKKVASGNVKSSGKGRVASTPGTIDDTLRETLANINSRDH